MVSDKAPYDCYSINNHSPTVCVFVCLRYVFRVLILSVAFYSLKIICPNFSNLFQSKAS